MRLRIPTTLRNQHSPGRALKLTRIFALRVCRVYGVLRGNALLHAFQESFLGSTILSVRLRPLSNLLLLRSVIVEA